MISKLAAHIFVNRLRRGRNSRFPFPARALRHSAVGWSRTSFLANWRIAFSLAVFLTSSTLDQAPLLGQTWKAAKSGIWREKENWKDPEMVPNGADKTATINVPGNRGYVVILDTEITLAKLILQSSKARLDASDKLTIHDSANLLQGIATLHEAIWTGPGTVNNSTTMNVTGGPLIDTSFAQKGRVNVEGTNNAPAALSVSKDFTNEGIITLHSVATGDASLILIPDDLAIVKPRITNALSGELRLEGLGITGVSGRILNDGLIKVFANASFITSTGNLGDFGAFENKNLVALAAGKTMEVNGNFAQLAGELRLLGDFSISGGTFSYFGGQITGNRKVALDNTNLRFGTNGLTSGTGPASFTMSGSGKIVGFDLATQTDIVPRISRNQSVTLLAMQNRDAEITAPTGLVNAGVLQLTSDGAGAAVLDLEGKTLVNHTKLAFLSGQGGDRVIRGALQNDGSVEVHTSAAIGDANSDSVNTGRIGIFGGTLTLNGKSFKNKNGGFFGGKGEKAVDASNLDDMKLSNAGALSPGPGIGLLGIEGDYLQETTGFLEIGLGGLIPETMHDVVEVSGMAQLDGDVQVAFAPGYRPMVGDEFTIFSSHALSGTFDSIIGPTPFARFSDHYGFDLDSDRYTVTIRVEQIPEPATLVLFAAGAVTLSRRRQC